MKKSFSWIINSIYNNNKSVTMMNNKSDSYYASGIDHKSLAAFNLTTYMFTHLKNNHLISY